MVSRLGIAWRTLLCYLGRCSVGLHSIALCQQSATTSTRTKTLRLLHGSMSRWAQAAKSASFWGKREIEVAASALSLLFNSRTWLLFLGTSSKISTKTIKNLAGKITKQYRQGRFAHRSFESANTFPRMFGSYNLI